MKINTASKHTRYGNMPATYRALYNLIPASVQAKCNAREIGALIDLLYAQKVRGENEMYAELRS